MIKKLQGIICQYTADESITISGDMALLTDLGLNSLELVEMVCAVEETFEVEIPDRAISNFKIVQDLVDYISSMSKVQ